LPNHRPPPSIRGTWAVPDEVKPGTYVSDGGEGCYWARLRDLTGGINSIIANGGDVGRQRVTILRSDKGFETNECGVWRKVGYFLPLEMPEPHNLWRHSDWFSSTPPSI